MSMMDGPAVNSRRSLSLTDDIRANSGKALRELSETVLNTLTQLEQKNVDCQDAQYRSLLASRCRELRNFVDNHPIDSLSAADRPLWVTDSKTSVDLTGQRIENWLKSSLHPVVTRQNELASRRSSGSSSSNSELPPSTSRSSVNSLRYKTEMCRSVSESGGACRYGDKCQYAHSRDELRAMPRHPRYKTQMCREYHLTSVCSYGVRCNFLHDEQKQLERMSSVGDEGEVFSLQGSWSGRSTPEVDLLMSRWIGSEDVAAKREGSVGSEVLSSSVESSGSSPLLVPVYSPFLAVVSGRVPSHMGVGQLLAESTRDTSQKRATNDVFQFPSCITVPNYAGEVHFMYKALC